VTPVERVILEAELQNLYILLDFYVVHEDDIKGMSKKEIEAHQDDILDAILEIKNQLEDE
jgi:hypothetical protein